MWASINPPSLSAHISDDLPQKLSGWLTKVMTSYCMILLKSFWVLVRILGRLLPWNESFMLNSPDSSSDD